MSYPKFVLAFAVMGFLHGQATVGLQTQQPRPDPNHGPYANRPGWFCHREQTAEKAKRVHCACKAKCDNDNMEDRACMTFCGSDQCLCHIDECH